MKYLKQSIQVLVFVSVALIGYYYFLFRHRIQITIANETQSKVVGQLTALVAGEQKIIQNIYPNEKVLMNFNPASDWFAPPNASDLTVRYLVQNENVEVAVVFPEIDEEKDYQFMITIKEDNSYQITELQN